MSEPFNVLPRHQYGAFLRQLPADWEQKEITQIGAVVGGSTPSREVPSFWRGSIPWVTPGEVSGEEAKLLHDTNDHISASGLAGSGANLLPAGSLLVTTRATLGARVINAVPMATNQGFKSIVFKKQVEASYYFHLFEKVKPELVRRASGTTFLEISGAEFGRIRVPSPSPDEKLKIAQVLDTLDTAIHETEAIIAKLKAVKHGLLHDLLTRGIAADGELRPPQAEAPHLYKPSPIGWIPNDWDARPLGQMLAEPTKNGLYKPSQFHGRGPLMVQMGGLFNGEAAGFQTATRVQVSPSEMNAFGLSIGDLLFARRSLVFEGAGLCVIVRNLPGPATFESSIVRVRVREDVAHPEFVCQFLRGEMSSAQRRTLIRQVAVSGVSSSDIRQLLIAIPTLDEQKLIVERQTGAQAQIIEEMLAVAKLRNQKVGLMDDLLTGHVRVTPLLAKAALQKGNV
jgi:type I restriction enzyme S subunit